MIVLKKQVRDLAKDIQFVVFDFDGVFTDNRVFINEKGEESVACNRSDGLGLARLKRLGLDLLVLSTEANPVVKRRAEKLKIRCIHNCKNKLKVLSQEAKKKGISLKQVAYMGNDINDAVCLEAVGLPVIVADAHKDVIRYARYKTFLRGGRGAVREFCDLVFRAKTEGKTYV